MSIYGKTLLKVFFSRIWILVHSIEDSKSTKFVQMMILGWPLIFLQQGQIYISLDLYGGESWKIFFFFNIYLRLMAETYNVWCM